MRLAWFSPMPPVRSGIAAFSAEIVHALGCTHEIDVFVDEPVAKLNPSTRSAHEFVWRHRRFPYDLTVYQIGNSSHHDYLWPYLFRYPGLAVLHDAHLHHARAAALLRTRRPADYRAEFAANHPDEDPGLAEIAVKGFDSYLYYWWPMTRLVAQASRLTAVHAPVIADALAADVDGGSRFGSSGFGGSGFGSSGVRGSGFGGSGVRGSGFGGSGFGGSGFGRSLVGSSGFGGSGSSGRGPNINVETIRLAHGTPLGEAHASAARRRGRQALGIPGSATVFGLFGGLSPEKRVPQVLDAFSALLLYAPSVRLLLAGAPAAHYDVAADVHARGLDEHVTFTGYLRTDEELTDAIAAADVAVNLRWPTAREMSGPWLRALAAGKPTVIMDLVHLAGVPSLDPRTWRTPGAERRAPVAVSIDILDEDHSLRLAMRRLATDGDLRTRLGKAARAYWESNHSLPCAIEDYERVIARAHARPAPRAELPGHLLTNGDGTLRGILNHFGVECGW